MSPGLRSLRAPLAWLSLTSLAACSGPEAPTIPPRDQIGPPEAAGDHCPRKVVPRFAQAYFQVADLELGQTCTGFIEQDECVIALFRDCTDQVSDIPRSWQGTIEEDGDIHWERTTETSGSVIARSPSECNGTLSTAAEGDIRVWAKLDCRVGMGTHGGFYFEKLPADNEPPVPPYITVGSQKTEVLLNPEQDNQLVDFAVLQQKNELWALVNAQSSIGLYTGGTSAAQLALFPTLVLSKPKRLVVDDAETSVVIADASNVHRLDPLAMTVTSTAEPGEIRALELTSAGVLIASSAGQNRTLLRFRDPLTLAQRGTEGALDGRVDRIVPLYEPSSRAIALLTFLDSTTVKLIDAELRDVMTVAMLPEIPDHAVAITGSQRVMFSAKDGGAIFSIRISDGSAPIKVQLPLDDVESLWWHKQDRLLLVSSRDRQLYPFDVDADRPLLQAKVSLEAELSIIRADASGRLFGMFGEDGVIRPLMR